MSSDGWSCCVCRHPLRTDIEAAIVSGRSMRSIAAEYGVSKTAVNRHKNEGHLYRTVKKAADSPLLPDAKRDEVLALVQTGELVKWTRGLLAKSVRILDAAEAAGDLRTALQGIHEARASIETLGKISGEIAQAGVLNQQVNVGISSDDYNESISRIIRALEPYPEARIAVLSALEGFEVVNVTANK